MFQEAGKVLPGNSFSALLYRINSVLIRLTRELKYTILVPAQVFIVLSFAISSFTYEPCTSCCVNLEKYKLLPSHYCHHFLDIFLSRTYKLFIVDHLFWKNYVVDNYHSDNLIFGHA